MQSRTCPDLQGIAGSRGNNAAILPTSMIVNFRAIVGESPAVYLPRARQYSANQRARCIPRERGCCGGRRKQPGRRPALSRVCVSKNLEGRKRMARPAGFEPAAFGSGGQRSIQLSYGRVEEICGVLVRLRGCAASAGQTSLASARGPDEVWRARQDSNLRPTDSKSGALSN